MDYTKKPLMPSAVRRKLVWIYTAQPFMPSVVHMHWDGCTHKKKHELISYWEEGDFGNGKFTQKD